MSDTSEKKLSRNEHIKADSHGLRGGIARGLGEVITGNYYSQCWIADAAGLNRKYTWSADTDFSMISERTLRLGVVWRWKHSKGLDYAEDFRRFQESKDRAAGRDGTPRVVSTARGDLQTDGWFPGMITDNSNVPG